MLKLIIVDDERIIRETIRNIIDWNSIGIEVIALCKNGIEAYDMILDENPDIVMTDIRMPGLSGLELISRLKETNQDIEYIILSGYGEFEYAKEAMKYGVKHYLLKPSNEEQIIQVMNIVKADWLKKNAIKHLQEDQRQLTDNLSWTIIRNIIAEGMTEELDLNQLLHKYAMYVDFIKIEYQVLYFYFLNPEQIHYCLQQIKKYFNDQSPRLQFYPVYVQQTLLIFFESFDITYTEMDAYFSDEGLFTDDCQIKYERQSFTNLTGLLENLLGRLRRFEVVNLIHDEDLIPIYNYHGLIERIESFSKKIGKAVPKAKKSLIEELNMQLSSVSDINFLKVLISTMLLKSSIHAVAPVMISEFLMEMNQMNTCSEVYNLFKLYEEKLFYLENHGHEKYKEFVNEIINYVQVNISNPSLSLKWIAENHLYMNVDYVSREFVKETGTKFSAFLTDVRINKAKELLIDQDMDNIYTVAEEVGCGNNPHYFSQIFKKRTGMPPSKYMKYMNGEN